MRARRVSLMRALCVTAAAGPSVFHALLSRAVVWVAAVRAHLTGSTSPRTTTPRPAVARAGISRDRCISPGCGLYGVGLQVPFRASFSHLLHLDSSAPRPRYVLVAARVVSGRRVCCRRPLGSRVHGGHRWDSRRRENPRRANHGCAGRRTPGIARQSPVFVPDRTLSWTGVCGLPPFPVSPHAPPHSPAPRNSVGIALVGSVFGRVERTPVMPPPRFRAPPRTPWCLVSRRGRELGTVRSVINGCD
jgi:hypothetical protein